MLLSKVCTKCKVLQPIEDFYKHKRSKDGIITQCKFCMRAYNKKWITNNKEQKISVRKAWVAANKKRIADLAKRYRSENKARLQAQNKAWKRANPDRLYIIERRSYLKTKYGLSLEEYDQLLEQQFFRCALCSKHKDQETIPLVIDHDHTTGKIRGLLCNDCNRNLISHRNDPQIFYKAAQYLEKNNSL